MDTSNFAKIIMNPVRLRIVQYLLIHETGTTAEIHNALSDVPTASLYRHIKTLLDSGCIKVVEETKVRGTVEKTYAMESQPTPEEPTLADISSVISSSLLSLEGSFLKYFDNADADPQKDMLTLQTSTLLLSDEEFMGFLQDIGAVIAKSINNEPTKDRKVRRFTLISSPNEE